MLERIVEKLGNRIAMFLMWLVLLSVVVWLGFREIKKSSKVLGFVDTETVQIKPMGEGRIEKIFVMLGDTVHEGQPIALIRKSTALNPFGDTSLKQIRDGFQEDRVMGIDEKQPIENLDEQIPAKPRPSMISVPLLASVDGKISKVFAQKGEVVNSITPVVEITPQDHYQIKICLSDTHAHELHWGSFIEGVSLDSSNTKITGHVTAISPRIEVLPERCQMYAGAKASGRLSIAEISRPSSALIPGQRFNFLVSTAHEWTKEVQHPLEETTVTVPHKIKVPPNISSQSSFEPSGLIWAEELQKYIVVSDDTGKKKSTQDAAWLFTMREDGVVDPVVYPIAGSKKIDDMESITRMGNHFYVMASLSENTDGKRLKKRGRFLKLEMNDGQFKVIDQIDFIKLLENLSPKERKNRLGFENLSELDVEGMTSSNGKLFFGLKSPLDEKGRSMIWVVEEPTKLFENQSIIKANLHLWKSFDLNRNDNSEVKYGISELLALPTGEFLIAANAISGNPKDPWGLIWKVDPEKTNEGQKLLFEYRKFKPEGLSLTPNKGNFLVTFDRGGKKKSRFIELPWIEP